MGKTIRIASGLQARAAFEPATFDAERGTVEIVWTTGSRGMRRPVFGEPYYEELEVSERACDLSRLNNGAPLLDAHDMHGGVRAVLGVVERAWIAGEQGRALVRFSEREDVKPIAQDVRSGILRHISVGYDVRKYEKVDEVEKTPVYRATAWQPIEVSLVPAGFDDAATVRSPDPQSTYEVDVFDVVTRAAGQACPATKEKQMSEQNQGAPQAAAPEESNVAVERAVQGAREAKIQAAEEIARQSARAAEEAKIAERARQVEIRKIVKAAKLGEDLAERMIESGADVEVVRKAVFDQLVKQDETESIDGHVRVTAGDDASEKFVKGASAWLLVRSGLKDDLEKARAKDPETFKGLSFDPGEFRGLTPVELARESLERRGVKTRGMDRLRMIQLAFTHRAAYQTTSDFSVLLENVLHKVLLGAYAITPDTWSAFCGTIDVPDFRTSSRYRTGAIPSLDVVAEHGEIKTKLIPDGAKLSFSTQKYGGIIGLTVETIMNDDMGALTNVAQELGRSARRTIEESVYTLLATNSGLGPTQSDSQAFFHSNRANVGTQAALSAAAIDADAAVMAAQKDPSGLEYLNLEPAVLLVPRALKSTANTINAAEYDPDAVTNKPQLKPNVCRGLFRQVVATPRLTGTRRYLFADPSIAPAIVVAFLEGKGRGPVLDSQDGWRMDGVEWRVRLYAKAQMGDPKGAVTNAG